MGLFHPSAGRRMEGRGARGAWGGEDGKTDSILPPAVPGPRAPRASLSPAGVPCLPRERGQGGTPALGWGAEGQLGAQAARVTPGLWAGTVPATLVCHPSPCPRPTATPAGVWGGWPPLGWPVRRCSAPCPGASGGAAARQPPPRDLEGSCACTHPTELCGRGAPGRGNALLGTAARRGSGSEQLTRSILLTPL